METWSFNKRGRIELVSEPVIMAIVNITEDSFVASSRIHSEKDFVNRIEAFVRAGATVIDIGGCATNPRVQPVEVEQEWQRLEPYLRLMSRHFPDLTLSLDTFRAEIVRRALTITNVDWVNDISGCEDEMMPDLLQKNNLTYILTYSLPISADKSFSAMRGDMLFWFAKQKDALNQKGIRDIIVDPGFGFNKNIKQNYSILAHLNEFTLLDCPVLVGVSRKRMLYELLACSPEEVVSATAVLHFAALQQGASILRVHDVYETGQIVKIFAALEADNMKPLERGSEEKPCQVSCPHLGFHISE